MAVRIAGVDLPMEKKIDIGLTVIYGIGRNNAKRILSETKVDPQKRVKDLTADEVSRLQKAVGKIPTEGELRRLISENINRLKTIGSYRGIRHAKGLPVRGQRTRSNARTKKGKRKTVGALRKKDISRFGTGSEEVGKEEKSEEGGKASA